MLSADEKKKACEAMAAGYADNFVKVQPGTAQSAHHRVLQRRGEVLADDREGGWANLANTRPGAGGDRGEHESKEDRDRRILAKLPYANQGAGGAQQAMRENAEFGLLKATAAKHGLKSRSQLRHARRMEEAQQLDRTYAKRYGLEALTGGASSTAAGDRQRAGSATGLAGASLADAARGSPTFTDVPMVDGDVKPFSGPVERPRDARAARSRAELLRLRRKQQLADSLRAAGDGDEAEKVERAPSPASDNEDALRKTGPLPGLRDLSRSRS